MAYTPVEDGRVGGNCQVGLAHMWKMWVPSYISSNIKTETLCIGLCRNLRHTVPHN